MAYQAPKALIRASKELCRSIISAVGGPSAIANSLEWNRAYFTKYRKLGYIPLQQVYDVSRFLNVSEWALSYYKLTEVFGEKAPPFKDIVFAAPIVDGEKYRILNLLHKDN